MPKTRYVNNYREVVDFFTSQMKRVTDATLVGDDLMLLQYQLINDAADASKKNQCHSGCFHNITCQNHPALQYATSESSEKCTLLRY